MEYIKKLSVKTVCGKIEFQKDDPEGYAMPLMQIFGIATGVQNGQSQFGDWEALTGNFEAVKLPTGESYRSGTLFMPEIAHVPVAGAIANSEGGVQFAIEIIAKKDSTVNVGYTYGMRPLIEPEESDPIKQLKAKALAALPAPKDAESEEAPKGKKK